MKLQERTASVSRSFAYLSLIVALLAVWALYIFGPSVPSPGGATRVATMGFSMGIQDVIWWSLAGCVFFGFVTFLLRPSR